MLLRVTKYFHGSVFCSFTSPVKTIESIITTFSEFVETDSENALKLNRDSIDFNI